MQWVVLSVRYKEVARTIRAQVAQLVGEGGAEVILHRRSQLYGYNVFRNASLFTAKKSQKKNKIKIR